MMGSTVRFDNGEETTTNALGMFTIPVGYEGGFSASGGVNAWTSEEMDESWVIVGHTSISKNISPLTSMAKHFMDDGDSVETAMEAASAISSFSILATMRVKEAVDRSYEGSLAEGLLFERRTFHSSNLRR